MSMEVSTHWQEGNSGSQCHAPSPSHSKFCINGNVSCKSLRFWHVFDTVFPANTNLPFIFHLLHEIKIIIMDNNYYFKWKYLKKNSFPHGDLIFVFSLSLSLPLWLEFVLYSWINHTHHMFSHLIPQGTPSILMPFMVYIELISNVIRPGTLAIRLSANMIAGHLLLTLLGNTGNSLSLIMINILLVTQIALLVLETAVAFIQSYVFAILMTLYSTETN